MRRATKHDVVLGQRLRAQRLSRGLSQEELADRLGVTFQQLQKYEKGTNRIAATRLQEISALLKLPISVWFDDNRHSLKSEVNFGEVQDFITSARTIRLLKSFAQIKDAETQNLIADLCERLAAKK